MMFLQGVFGKIFQIADKFYGPPQTGFYERLWKIKRADADSNEEYLLPRIYAPPCKYLDT